ncbi:hypothetical protein GGI07_002393 [Coemansia sp. Benny D115]|nr:hypothetical protein GGI07_002393 [Coemansia sp. Benny D115]
MKLSFASIAATAALFSSVLAAPATTGTSKSGKAETSYVGSVNQLADGTYFCDNKSFNMYGMRYATANPGVLKLKDGTKPKCGEWCLNVYNSTGYATPVMYIGECKNNCAGGDIHISSLALKDLSGDGKHITTLDSTNFELVSCDFTRYKKLSAAK